MEKTTPDWFLKIDDAEPVWFGLKINDQMLEIIPWYFKNDPVVSNFKRIVHQYENYKIVKLIVKEM